MRVLLFVIALVLAGCQTVPENPPTLLSPAPADGGGRIVLRPFYMPAGLNLIAGIMGGGTTGFNVDVYDVTDQPRHLGLMSSPGVLNGAIQTAWEYDVPAGRRILMLRMKKFGGGDFVDFAEVNVAPRQIEHVAISQYGMNDRTYLVPVAFDARATRYCGYTAGVKPKEATEYFKAQGLPETKYGWRYCQALSSHSRVRAIPGGSTWGGPLTQEQVAKLRDQYLPVWRSMADRTPPYDLSAPGQKGM